MIVRCGCRRAASAQSERLVALWSRRRPLSSSAENIVGRCDALHTKFVQPLNDRLHGPLEKSSRGGYRTTKLPFVFLLGNHSSGKSSFINFCLGRDIQKAGVAPTDDSFTVIAPGPSDIDQDGPALIGDPDLGFSGLRQFGPALVHHTSLKVRCGTSTDSFMMVDSPGMIDSPVSRQSVFDMDHSRRMDEAMVGGHTQRNLMDRGYNFEGVVRWFAERADVILLFFDPDKPGTTGETLSILTNSLPGMDHKLYIILNKADRFERIHDFARAYGSLCWNLSKVIQRKDLPRIYTMCLPVSSWRQEGLESPSEGLMSAGLRDLEHTRDDVRREVMKAPNRRIDNVITRLTDSVHLLQVHATVLGAMQKDYRKVLWRQRAATLGTVTLGAAASGASAYAGLPMEATLGAGALALVGTLAVHVAGSGNLRLKEEKLTSTEGLNRLFQKSYARELAEGDEWVNSVWKRIREGLKLTLSTNELSGLSTIKRSELDELQRILDDEIPKLRRSAAPSHFSSSESR